MTPAPYVEALSRIARALHPPDGPCYIIAWDVELLPGQVERELTRLRLQVQELEAELQRSRAWTAYYRKESPLAPNPDAS